MKGRDLSTLHWFDHAETLWLLGMLYLRPNKLKEALTELTSHRTQVGIGIKLFAHSLPYIFAIVFVAQLTLSILFNYAFDITLSLRGIVVGNILGITLGTTVGIFIAVLAKITEGVALGTALGIALEIVYGIIIGAIAGNNEGATLGIAVGIIVGIALGVIFLRLFYLPWHLSFIFPIVKGQSYHKHPVAWDNLCGIPLWRLDHLLVDYASKNPEAGEIEIERLIDTYPSQRASALRAKTTLIARKAGQIEKLSLLTNALYELPEGQKGYLQQTKDVHEMVYRIAMQQIRLNIQSRLFVRREIALGLVGLIDSFYSKVAGYHEPLASEFRKAAQVWKQKAQLQLDQTEQVLRKEPAVQVFQAGRPIDTKKEAFVPRYSIIEKLVEHAAMTVGSPGVVLYGRRRTGKSTTIQNLHLFLPAKVTPVQFSMQNPNLSTSIHSFWESMTESIQDKWPLYKVPTITTPNLAGFYNFLTTCSTQLEQAGHRLMICIDEYEYIDSLIKKQVFPEAILHTFRESIQQHRGLIWVFAGSHKITELEADWTSYLISARTINMPAFTPEETRLLLTQPLSQMKSEDRQVKFEPGFWGEGGIDTIYEETQGWPHLVQLVAQTSIDLLNESDEKQMTKELLEQAFIRSVEDAETTLSQLLKGESRLSGEWEYLLNFQKSPDQPAPVDSAIASSLRRRELIEVAENGSWHIRVPLFQRWLLTI